MRKIILGKGSKDEQNAGLQGNTVLLAQPTTGDVMRVLPPQGQYVCDRIAVIFTTDKSDVSKAKPLFVSRSLYEECICLRQTVCYAYADVVVGDLSGLPEDGVPGQVMDEALCMPEAKFFEGRFDSVARPQDPVAKEVEQVEAEEEDAPGTDPDDDGIQGEESELLLGLDEGHADDPLAQMSLVQKRLRAMEDEGNRALARQADFRASGGKDHDHMVAAQAHVEQSKQHFMHMAEICRKVRPDDLRHCDPASRSVEQLHLRAIDEGMRKWRQRAFFLLTSACT